jgi:hypothetical protein
MGLPYPYPAAGEGVETFGRSGETVGRPFHSAAQVRESGVVCGGRTEIDCTPDED